MIVVIDLGVLFIVKIILVIIVGLMFVMWMLELIIERGIGNGVFLFIFVNIVVVLF